MSPPTSSSHVPIPVSSQSDGLLSLIIVGDGGAAFVVVAGGGGMCVYVTKTSKQLAEPIFICVYMNSGLITLYCISN